MSSAMRDTNQELLSLMKQALAHAGDLIERGGRLYPFVISVGHDGRRDLQRHRTDEHAEGIRRAAAGVEDGRGAVRLAVIAFDSSLRLSAQEGGRQPALIVEGHHVALEGPAFRLAQPYRPGTPAGFLIRARPPQRHGTLRFIGNGRNLLLDPQDRTAHPFEVAAA